LREHRAVDPASVGAASSTETVTVTASKVRPTSA
jgi:hypothetical protein